MKPKKKKQKKSKAETSSEMQDFESSYLRFEYDALIEEYKILWTEIQSRNSDQQQIVNYSLTLVTAFFAISQIFADSASVQILRPVYPLLTFVFSAFALLFHHHSTMMAHIGIYTNNVLRPRIEKILSNTNNNPQIWLWNEWRGKYQFSKFPNNLFELGMSSAGYIVTFVPGIAFITLFWLTHDHTRPLELWEQILLALSSLSIIWVIITGVYTVFHFRRIG